MTAKSEPGPRLSATRLAETRAALRDLGRRLDELAAEGASEATLDAALVGMRLLHGLIEEHLAAGAPPVKRKARAASLQLAAA